MALAKTLGLAYSFIVFIVRPADAVGRVLKNRAAAQGRADSA